MAQFNVIQGIDIGVFYSLFIIDAALSLFKPLQMTQDFLLDALFPFLAPPPCLL